VREPWALPSDWHWAEWKSVARVASNLVSPADHSTLPHVAPNHIESGTGKLLPYNTVAEDQVISAKHLFAPGQILYSKIRPYLAKTVVVDFAGLCSADMYPVATDLDARYLKWWMLSPDFTRFAAGEQARTVLPKINTHALGRLPVPVAPPAEQRRIVALLEDHLSRLDAAQVDLAVAARRAERLRWSAAMAQVRKAGGTEVRLGEIADVRNGIFVSRAGTEPDGIPILRIGAVRSLSLDLSDLRYSRRDESDLRAADALALPGDLLFTRYNGNPQFVGACAVVPADAPTLTYPDKLIRVRIADDDALPSFVALACSVGGARARIQAAVRTTAGQAGISGRDLKAVTLLLPDRDAQRSAVAAANDADVAVRRLSDAISSGQHRGVALRHSLLTAAFSGQLAAETATA
jgi:type I restriction enzyme, S subunit